MNLPRGLILLSAAWLFLSWLGSMGLHPPLVAATSSYTPSVRIMLFSSAAGALIAWPMLRFCQPPSLTPIRDTSLDLAVVIGMLNMVLWPLRLVTPWPPQRMALLMLFVMLSIVAIGAVVALGRASRRAWVRSAAMGVVLLMAVGFMPWRIVAPNALPRFPSVFGGPFEAILATATPGGAPPMPRDWAAIEGAAAMALSAWAVTLLVLLWRNLRRSRGLPRSDSADTLAAWN